MSLPCRGVDSGLPTTLPIRSCVPLGWVGGGLRTSATDAVSRPRVATGAARHFAQPGAD
jgi:hypothetical protein